MCKKDSERPPKGHRGILHLLVENQKLLPLINNIHNILNFNKTGKTRI